MSCIFSTHHTEHTHILQLLNLVILIRSSASIHEHLNTMFCKFVTITLKSQIDGDWDIRGLEIS